MQEVFGRILKSRIEREKASNTLNIEEITSALNILIAGGSITAEQYGDFTEMIAPTETTVS